MSEKSQTSEHLFLLDTAADFTEHALKLASQSRRNIAILSHDLDKSVFGTEDFANALSRMARENRNANLQILVKNTKHLAEIQHKLVKLSQRLTSKITIRKLTVEPDDDKMEFMLCDTSALLYKNTAEIYRGFANYDAAVEVKRLREVFDYIWQYGETDSELQILNL